MSSAPDSLHGRRSFLGALSALTGLAVLRPADAGAALADARSSTRGPQQQAWDLTWLDALKGKHKQVFDLSADLGTKGPSLNVIRNYLNAHRDVYGLSFPDVDTLVGITRNLPLNVGDATWAKYKLGETWKVKDPQNGGAWATRNVWLADVEALQKRGTIFWQCNNALGGVARELAEQMKMTPEAVRAELIAGFIPGVKLVPAHTMALGLAQEHGCAYQGLS